MAAARHSLTRRALLGAGAGACVAAAAPSAPGAPVPSAAPSVPAGEPAGAGAASAEAWKQALALYRRAEAHLAAFRHHIERLPPERRAFPACEPFEERFDDLECARLAALKRLLRAPAPDLPALALKIELTIDDQAWELTGAESCLAALKADAWRLLR